jgi:excisionase family DNA binding protein
MASDYLTPDDVASHLKVSRQVVYNWINDGRLRAVKAGRTLRIPQYALEAFLQPVHAGDISAGGVEPEPRFHRDRFTPAAQAAIEAASSEVRRRQHIQAEVEHTLWALVQPADGIVPQALRQLGVDPQQVAQQLDQALAKLPSDPTLPDSRPMLAIAPRLGPIMARMEELASQLPDLQIDASHIFLAICEEADGVSAQILRSFGVTPERLRLALLDIRAAQQAAAPQPGAHHNTDREQSIEQRLTQIETELAAMRAMLTRPGSSGTT